MFESRFSGSCAGPLPRDPLATKIQRALLDRQKFLRAILDKTLESVLDQKCVILPCMRMINSGRPRDPYWHNFPPNEIGEGMTCGRTRLCTRVFYCMGLYEGWWWWYTSMLSSECPCPHPHTRIFAKNGKSFQLHSQGPCMVPAWCVTALLQELNVRFVHSLHVLVFCIHVYYRGRI